MRSSVAILAVIAVGVALGGCADTKPLQSELKDLHDSVDRLAGQVRSARSASDSAAQSARQAQQAAEHASSTAQQALVLAQADQKSIDATNEKLERMFRHRLSK